MANQGAIDLRLQKITKILERYVAGDFTGRESYAENGDELDHIIRLINNLGSKVQRSGQQISNYESRVSAIMNVLLKYTFFDFSEKAEVSDVGDEIDAIALALNTLGEELNDRIIAEKTHLEELEKLAAVIETTADAIISITPEGLITHWNKSAEKIYGYAAAEMVGKDPSAEFTPEEEKENTLSMIKKVRAGQQVINAASKRIRKDRIAIDISLTLTPIFDANGKIISISELSRDITEQKKAEHILRESEEKFRSLVEGVKDYAIVMLDPNGNVASWNRGAETIKGYTGEEVMGRNFSIFYSEEDRNAGLPQKLLAEATEYGKATSEGFRYRKDGSTFWGYVVITCLRDEANKVIGFSKIIRDLTESKEKDDEIRKYTLRVEQKNLELERTNKELASFAYVSSHDLQEPLRKIQTFASRILETDFNNLSAQGKDYFTRMNSSANRMQQLILDILDYSKLTTTDTKTEMLDLNKLIDEVLEEFTDQIEEKEAEVRVGRLCEVPIIGFQFKQLISNLISNSLKFSSPKRKLIIKIKSEVTQQENLPRKAGFQKGRYCHLTFSDNGIGFEPHFNGQIFEVFQRLHNQEIYKGTGIGLAICKKIVENHVGIIEAQGELDKGATFHIYLPL